MDDKEMLEMSACLWMRCVDEWHTYPACQEPLSIPYFFLTGSDALPEMLDLMGSKVGRCVLFLLLHGSSNLACNWKRALC